MTEELLFEDALNYLNYDDIRYVRLKHNDGVISQDVIISGYLQTCSAAKLTPRDIIGLCSKYYILATDYVFATWNINIESLKDAITPLIVRVKHKSRIYHIKITEDIYSYNTIKLEISKQIWERSRIRQNSYFECYCSQFNSSTYINMTPKVKSYNIKASISYKDTDNKQLKIGCMINFLPLYTNNIHFEELGMDYVLNLKYEDWTVEQLIKSAVKSHGHMLQSKNHKDYELRFWNDESEQVDRTLPALMPNHTLDSVFEPNEKMVICHVPSNEVVKTTQEFCV